MEIQRQLGKLRAIRDPRTIALARIFKDQVIPATPDNFDVDASLGVSIPDPMYGNNYWGDCVMAGRAHMSRRFEQFEQKLIIPITDTDVLNEYWREQGYHPPPSCLARFFNPTRPNGGLYMLNSLNWWRQTGWLAASHSYDIAGYAGINWLNHLEVMAAMAYLRGDYVGIALPLTAQHQDVWDVVTPDNPQTVPGSWGYHCVYRKAYSGTKATDTIKFVSWGKEYEMTWQFADKYLDESYGVVQDKAQFVSNSPVDVQALENILQQITA
jgi:hypothetical protein